MQVRLKSKLSQLHEVANGWAQVVLADGDSAKCSAAPLSSEELDRAFAFFDGDSYGQVHSLAVGKFKSKSGRASRNLSSPLVVARTALLLTYVFTYPTGRESRKPRCWEGCASCSSSSADQSCYTSSRRCVYLHVTCTCACACACACACTFMSCMYIVHMHMHMHTLE